MKSAAAQKAQAIAQHSEQASAFAARYQRLAVDPYESCFAYSRYRLDALLDRYLPTPAQGLRLLDVGCGTGNQLVGFRLRGFDVDGVDGSAEMIAFARRNNPGVNVQQSDVEALPFASASFDVVVCIEVLRYLPRVSRCLSEIARVLRPGGVCLATAAPVLNLNGYWLVNRVASAVPLPGLVRLRQYFTSSIRLKRELRSAGFGAVDVHGVYVGPINWIERAAPHKLRTVLRMWDRIDARLADQSIIREFANMFLARAVRDRDDH